MDMSLLISTVAQGLLWALMALGVYITFRVLDIADLTVEGSFPLGATVANIFAVRRMRSFNSFINGDYCGRFSRRSNWFATYEDENTGIISRYPNYDCFIFSKFTYYG